MSANDELSKTICEYLESRLQEWADFFQHDYSGIGFPRKNILQRVREMGGTIIRGTGKKYPPDNASAREIEEWVKEVADYYPGRAQALRIKYFYPFSKKLQTRKFNHWLADEKGMPLYDELRNPIVHDFYISEKWFERNVLMAKICLEGRILEKDRLRRLQDKSLENVRCHHWKNAA